MYSSHIYSELARCRTEDLQRAADRERLAAQCAGDGTVRRVLRSLVGRFASTTVPVPEPRPVQLETLIPTQRTTIEPAAAEQRSVV